MSHLSSPPPKHKGEHKGHGLPRGSERWAVLGAGVSPEQGCSSGGGQAVEWAVGMALICVTHPLMPGVAPPGTRTEVLRSVVQCPCLLEGREAGLAAHRLHPRGCPTA
jgi:hypothetical protein